MARLEKYITKRGFLPEATPLRVVQNKTTSTDIIGNVAAELPKLLLTNQIRPTIDKLKNLDLHLDDHSLEEQELLFAQLSFIAHAYVWGDLKPVQNLPHNIGSPWVKLSEKFKRPPILSYASYCLHNWYKINETEDISLDNVALINNFLGGIDEDWFVTIHVCIEDAASPAILSVAKIVDDELWNNETLLAAELQQIKKSMVKVNEIFRLMPEKCDPYIYYHRVRPYIFGWKNNPDLPDGLIYDGFFHDKPQLFRGETGAQSSIIPTLDALFNVHHEKDELRDYLEEMKLYMPDNHRNFIRIVGDESNVEDAALTSSKINSLVNDCLDEMTSFRSQHLQYAADYIHQQNVKSTLFGTGGSTVRGTGGTPFMKYLKKHRDETNTSKR